MRVGVDINWMVGQYRGMGRFGRQLVAPVAESVTALAPEGVTTSDWPCVSRGRSFFPWWEQIELPRLCKSERLDWLLCPYNTGPLRSLGTTRAIAVIHDLIFLQPWSVLPASRSPYQVLGRVYRRQVVPAFVSRASRIITVSNFSKGEIVERFGFAEDDIRVIPNTIPDSWFEEPVPLDERQPVIFTVAGEQPSKNVRRLIEAFARSRLWADHSARLIIAGISSAQQKQFADQARALDIGTHVMLLGYVTDAELRRHYRHARAFVFASLFEGFGIPLLEAMASGTPIACSSTTSMPEVIGPHGLLFDPYDVGQMAERLRELWEHDEVRARQVQGALGRARSFSEAAGARVINDFWNEIT